MKGQNFSALFGHELILHKDFVNYIGANLMLVSAISTPHQRPAIVTTRAPSTKRPAPKLAKGKEKLQEDQQLLVFQPDIYTKPVFKAMTVSKAIPSSQNYSMQCNILLRQYFGKSHLFVLTSTFYF